MLVWILCFLITEIKKNNNKKIYIHVASFYLVLLVMDFFFLISTTTPVLKGCDHFCIRWKKIRRTRYKYVNTVLKRDIVVSGGNTLNQIRAADTIRLIEKTILEKKIIRIWVTENQEKYSKYRPNLNIKHFFQVCILWKQGINLSHVYDSTVNS